VPPRYHRRMVRRTSIEWEGRTRHCLEAGAGWPLILLHAFPLSAEMWRPVLERVPDGWHYVAPDLRGFGASTPATTGASLDDHAADIEGLLNALELERAVIGGLSMGGYIAFALMRRAPERVSALVLADTRAGADSPEGRQGRRAMSELVRAEGPAAIADRMLPTLLAHPEEACGADVRRLIEGNSVEGIDHALHAMRERPDSTPLLARISIPTLVIVGEHDATTPLAEAELIHQSLSRSHLVVIPDAGHLSAVEQPEAFAMVLENFLTSNL
jgi:3-oxoadipate enol-lactonase